MALLIGIDVGTGGTKAAFYTEDGTLVTDAFEASDIRRPAPGAAEEDPERQLGSVVRTIAELVKRLEAGPEALKARGASAFTPHDVAAIAIDGQMAGVIGIGADGRAVTPYDSWLDTRCAPQIATMETRAGDTILERAGCAPSFNHGPKIVSWSETRPDVFERIARFVQPGGYVAARLCGLTADEAFIDTTYLHFSGFADSANARWDPELCAEFGIPVGKLPRIVDPQEIVGALTSEFARATGLPAGVSIVAGCGDTAASFLSCGATAPGVCVDVAGTASVFAATTSAFRPDRATRTLACGRSAVPGLWHPYAYINGGGMNLRWFQRELGSDATMADLDAAAAGIEASASAGPAESGGSPPLFVPHLAGRVSPAMPHLRGAWVGLDWSHTSAHLYRATLEGVALEYGLYARIVAELYPELDLREIRVTGGGGASAIWNRIKASVLNAPVATISGAGGAPMGSAMLAAFGVGVFSDLPSAAARWVTAVPAAEPEPASVAWYRRRVASYRRLVDVLNEFHEGEAREDEMDG